MAVFRLAEVAHAVIITAGADAALSAQAAFLGEAIADLVYLHPGTNIQLGGDTVVTLSGVSLDMGKNTVTIKHRIPPVIL